MKRPFLLALPIALAGMPAWADDGQTLGERLEANTVQSQDKTFAHPLSALTVGTSNVHWTTFTCPDKYVRVANDAGQPKCAPEGSLIDGAFK